MVAFDYKSPLYFYSTATGGGNITMEDYADAILPIVKRRMQYVEK